MSRSSLYLQMTPQREQDTSMLGPQAEANPEVTAMKQLGFARDDSMDITNDPRFFGDNVLDKRLEAFSGLGVVSGLLVGTAIDQTFYMKKDFNLFVGANAKDYVQFSGFLLMTLVLYLNIISTYVPIAQTYHTYRLMTGGPTGFEHAKLYYLNPNVTFYRHIAIKGMLNSLWIFMLSSGFRMWVKFSSDVQSGPEWVSNNTSTAPEAADPQQLFYHGGLTGFGIVVGFVYWLMGLSVFWLHVKHVQVFRERYEQMAEVQEPLLSVVNTVNRRGQGLFPFLDV